MACSVNMYFGESVIPGVGLKVFMSDGEPVQVDNYDITALSEAIGLNFTTFTLREGEILASANFNTWLQWNAVTQHADSLGVQAFEDLCDMTFADFSTDVLSQFTTFLTDGSSETFAQSINELTESEKNWALLKQVHDYIKNIADDNYGRKYLIEIGDNNSGVCIKDRFGNPSNFDLIAENEGGLFYTSDSPAPDGGWPNNGQVQILGLNIGDDTQTFQQGDFRLGCFVAFDQITDINKGFGNTAHPFDLKLSSLDADSYFKKDEKVYLSASIANKIYQIENKQYVLVELANKPELMLSLGNVNNCGALAANNGCATLLTLFEGSAYDNGEVSLRDRLLCANCPSDDHAPCDTSAGGTASDTTSFNLFASTPPTIIPDHFVLPMKSNLFVYGPWFYQANPVGGTVVEPNRELKPWNFAGIGDDGYDNMDYYGNLIAADGPRGLQSQENGSITVAALPNYTIGYLVSANAATLTDIQMNVGSGGFTTSYNFQTYTPKFGSPGRHIANLWSKNYRRMSYLNKFFREQGQIINRLINAKDAALQIRRNKTIRTTSTDPVVDQGPRGGNSPGIYFFGGFRFRNSAEPSTNSSGGDSCIDGSGRSGPAPVCKKCEGDDCYADDSCGETMGSAPTLSDGNIIKNRPWSNLQPSYTWEWANKSGNTFKNIAFMSVDMLMSPISTNQEDGTKLPRLAMYKDYDCSDLEYSEKTSYNLNDPGRPPNSKPRLELPPFFIDGGDTQYNLPINQYYLNSVTSQAMLSSWDARINSSDKGFITNIISYGTEASEFPFSLTEDDEQAKQDQTSFRYNALRGPLTLQAWGYDTSGKPIPNAIDAAADTEEGKFRNKGLTDKFLQNWLENPKTWPAGPIDLRWDRERGVWVSPPANKVVVARLLTNLTPNGVAEAELFDPEGGSSKFYEYYDIWDKDGSNVKSALSKTRIKVYDFLGVSLCKCDIVYAYYDDNRYIVLESSRAYQDPNEGCCITQTTSTPEETTQEPPSVATPTSCWCGLECLQSLDNYKSNQHQALVHTQTTGGEDCLVWEDIVECYTTPPANLIDD